MLFRLPIKKKPKRERMECVKRNEMQLMKSIDTTKKKRGKKRKEPDFKKIAPKKSTHITSNKCVIEIKNRYVTVYRLQSFPLFLQCHFRYGQGALFLEQQDRYSVKLY